MFKTSKQRNFKNKVASENIKRKLTYKTKFHFNLHVYLALALESALSVKRS